MKTISRKIILAAFILIAFDATAQDPEMIQLEADSLIEAGNYAQAIQLLESNLPLFEEESDVLYPLITLSHLWLATNEYQKPANYMQKIGERIVHNINYNFSIMSESERKDDWEMWENYLTFYYSLSHFYPVDSVNQFNYNNTLFTKGLLLRVQNNIRDAIYSSGNQTLISQYEELGNLNQQLQILNRKYNPDKEWINSLWDYYNESDWEEIGRQGINQRIHAFFHEQNLPDEGLIEDEYISLVWAYRSLDRIITQQAFLHLKNDLSTTWQDVQNQLANDEAAVEFVSFRLYNKNWTDTTLYAALVLRPGMSAPQWIPLCEAKELEQYFVNTGGNQMTQIEEIYTQNGNKIYQLMWQPLKKSLEGVKTIYYSPAGLLHKLSFDALPLESGQYNLYLVSSTREIAKLKQANSENFPEGEEIIYGGLTYDEPKTHAHKTAKPADNGDDRRRRRDSDTPALDLRAASGIAAWKYLEGTRTETEQIIVELNNHKISNQYYTESAGDERSFKQLSGSNSSILHLSTHGFFFPDIVIEHFDGIAQRLGGSNTKRAVENPLLRSGLVLSGVNKRWLADKELADKEEDGILTAEEISQLNLTKTKLVVLSACETGLGDVKNSEGVFGLQRAFKLAGVESLIMSLWKVPDEATSELMTAFYRQWLAGKTKQEAFKMAQKQVREKYQSPYYWAAFVMMD
ncbi:MAG: CHAT domain-containing protein [Dysgonamonadaceae bacterium]|jgi:CHAT domain-containing protein|nr:CHAT domain-containing protein [Dysgonamonadaceae bacterium]